MAMVAPGPAQLHCIRSNEDHEMPDNSDRIGSARRTAELLAPLPAKLAAEGPCPGEVAKKNATRELRGWRNISGSYWDRYLGPVLGPILER
jgi:hypothetical protein